MRLSESDLNNLIRKALREDFCYSDITTKALINPKLKIRAVIFAKQDCILSGLDIAKSAFKLMERGVKFKNFFFDGDRVGKGAKVLEIFGLVRKILSAERVGLNFLSHLSGVATLTSKFVKALSSPKAKILDTRKTTPLLRRLEKYAVRCGGGLNHRMSLKDFILIKDNHKRAFFIQRHIKDNSLKSLVAFAKKKIPPNVKIEIEVENIKEFKEALGSSANIIMLDNMSVSQLRHAVRLRNRIKPAIKLEASGTVNLKNIKNIAATGVDFISIGSLTHSSPAIDFSLEITDTD